MYTHRRFTISVRDGATRYGGHGPSPAEDHPGARALLDLSDAPAPDFPAILARYATLRAWALRQDSAPGPVIAHALSAAREHLESTPRSWSERVLLRRALEPAGGEEALKALEAAARCAEEIGHPHGARALRQAVHRARWRALRYPPPSPS